MGLRGPKPKGKVKIKWSPNFAYAIGLIATDGNLSSDRRHIAFVSKDIEQINNFMKCLGLDVKIGKNISGYNGNSAHKVQFGDVLFYNFLETIGLHPNKSKTIGKILVPEIFFDFLRGCLDGDGPFIPIGIQGGGLATCFIWNLYPQALTMLHGLEKR